MRRTMVTLLTAALLLAAAPPPAKDDETVTFKASSNLVIVTVFVRDKQGRPVTGLTKEDFVVEENKKPQAISVFEFQNLEAPPAPERGAAGFAQRREEAKPEPQPEPEGRERYRDRRLMILFFDWSALQQEDQIRALDAARKWINEQMKAPPDLVAIATSGANIKIEQDFTDDTDALLAVLNRIQPGMLSELAEELSTEEDTAEESAFQADMTELNLFNTDRKLAALEQLAQKFGAMPEKKAVIWFSSGVGRTGAENESQLRSTVNAAVRANVSFYPVDVRGLIASAPAGDASAAAGRGTGIYSGQAQRQQRDQRLSTQDTLYSLALDTGGKPLVDNNDLALGARQAQRDLQSYYILGYYSDDERKDGRFRNVQVKLTAKTGLALDFRRGYFAAKEFTAFNATDKERQLQDALALGDPVTDLPIALEVDVFRLNKGKAFVPVSVKIPGSLVPLQKKGGAETTEFDFLAQVRDSKGQTAAALRDAIRIQLRQANVGRLASRSLVYDTAFSLTPGRYRLKMLVRENQSGKMGTFETAFTVPEFTTNADTLAISTPVLSTQRAPVAETVGRAQKKAKEMQYHPLVRGGQKTVPSVTRVFHTDQTLLVYAEAYGVEEPALTASVGFYRGGKKVFESRPVLGRELLKERPGSIPLAFEIPLRSLAPGQYTAQLNVIDAANGRFAFARVPLAVTAQTKPAGGAGPSRP